MRKASPMSTMLGHLTQDLRILWDLAMMTLSQPSSCYGFCWSVFWCWHNVWIFQNTKFKQKPPTRGLQQAGMFARVYKSALRNPYFEVLSLLKKVQVRAILVLWILLKCFLVLTQRTLKFCKTQNFNKKPPIQGIQQAGRHVCMGEYECFEKSIFWSRPFKKSNLLWVFAVDRL